MTTPRNKRQQRATQQARDYRGIELLRGAWGAALLVAPDRILSAIHGFHVDTKAASSPASSAPATSPKPPYPDFDPAPKCSPWAHGSTPSAPSPH